MLVLDHDSDVVEVGRRCCPESLGSHGQPWRHWKAVKPAEVQLRIRSLGRTYALTVRDRRTHRRRRRGRSTTRVARPFSMWHSACSTERRISVSASLGPSDVGSGGGTYTGAFTSGVGHRHVVDDQESNLGQANRQHEQHRNDDGRLEKSDSALASGV